MKSVRPEFAARLRSDGAWREPGNAQAVRSPEETRLTPSCRRAARPVPHIQHRHFVLADRGLRDLRDQRLRVPQQQALEYATSRELLLEKRRLHPESAARNLSNGSIRSCVAPKEQGDAYYPVISGESHFGGRTIFHRVQERNHRGGREIEII